MTETAKVEIDLDTAQATRKANTFQLKMAAVGRTGAGAAGGMGSAFGKLLPLFAATAAAVGVIGKAIDIVTSQARRMDTEVAGIYERARARARQAAQEMGGQSMADYLSVMPAGTTEAQGMQHLIRRGAAVGKPWQEIQAMEFPIRSKFIGKEGLAQLPGALADAETLMAGGKTPGELAGQYTSFLYGPLQMKKREQRAQALAEYQAAYSGSDFTAAQLGDAMMRVGPFMTGLGIPHAKQVEMIGSLSAYFPGKPRLEAGFVKSFLTAGMRERTDWTKNLLQKAGVDPNTVDAELMMITVSDWIGQAKTPQEKAARGSELMQKGGFDDVAVQGIITLSTGRMVMGKYVSSYRGAGKVLGSRIAAARPETMKRAAVAYRQQESVRIRSAELGKLLPKYTPSEPGSMESMETAIGEVEAAHALADPHILQKDDAAVALIQQQGRDPGAVFDEGKAGLRGEDITAEENLEIVKLDRHGLAVFQALNAMEARAQQGGEGWLSAQTFARRHKALIKEAKDRAYNAWGPWEGSTKENITSYRMRIKEAMQALTRLRKGMDPVKGKKGVYWAEAYQTDTSNLPLLGEPKTRFHMQDVYRQDTDIIWRTDKGEVLPDFQGPVSAPGQQQSTNINMQILNFAHTPRAVNQFRRGGTWNNPSPLA